MNILIKTVDTSQNNTILYDFQKIYEDIYNFVGKLNTVKNNLLLKLKELNKDASNI